MGRDSASATQLPPLARTGSECSRRSCSISHVCSSIASSCSIGPSRRGCDTSVARAFPCKAHAGLRAAAPRRSARRRTRPGRWRRCPRATTFASPRRKPGGATHPDRPCAGTSPRPRTSALLPHPLHRTSASNSRWACRSPPISPVLRYVHTNGSWPRSSALRLPGVTSGRHRSRPPQTRPRLRGRPRASDRGGRGLSAGNRC